MSSCRASLENHAEQKYNKHQKEPELILQVAIAPTILNIIPEIDYAIDEPGPEDNNVADDIGNKVSHSETP